MLLVPPSTPKAVLAKLQAATAKIVRDAKFLAEAKKRKRTIKFIGPDKAKAAVATVLESVTPAQRAAIRKVVLEN
jgi:tripartite-type tricarboxylate transporter receptor subunit TctC